MDLREIDVLVAEKVLGMRVERVRPPWYQGGHVEVLCFYAPGFDHMEYSYDANSCNAMMYRNGRDSSDGTAPSLPYYSDDIAAAWQVVERIATLRRGEDKFLSGPPIFRLEGPDSDGEYQAGFVFDNTLDCMHLSWEGGKGEYANTAPLAICRAALRTVGVTPESV